MFKALGTQYALMLCAFLTLAMAPFPFLVRRMFPRRVDRTSLMSLWAVLQVRRTVSYEQQVCESSLAVGAVYRASRQYELGVDPGEGKVREYFGREWTSGTWCCVFRISSCSLFWSLLSSTFF